MLHRLEIPEDDQPLEGAGEQHRHGLELVRRLRAARPGMAAPRSATIPIWQWHAQQDFIYHLSKVGVPAIMGFLWNVDDPNAKAYADTFYKHLFSKKERSLEYACLEAKKEMRARYVRNPIWASSVLVMQVDS